MGLSKGKDDRAGRRRWQRLVAGRRGHWSHAGPVACGKGGLTGRTGSGRSGRESAGSGARSDSVGSRSRRPRARHPARPPPSRAPCTSRAGSGRLRPPAWGLTRSVCCVCPSAPSPQVPAVPASKPRRKPPCSLLLPPLKAEPGPDGEVVSARGPEGAGHAPSSSSRWGGREVPTFGAHAPCGRFLHVSPRSEPSVPNAPRILDTESEAPSPCHL